MLYGGTVDMREYRPEVLTVQNKTEGQYYPSTEPSKHG